MAPLWKAILLTSSVGTVFAIILGLLRPITRKNFSSSWHYYIWLVVLITMMLPIQLNLPSVPAQSPPAYSMPSAQTDPLLEHVEAVEPLDTQFSPPANLPQTKETWKLPDLLILTEKQVEGLSLLWAIVAVVLFLIKLVNYWMFLFKIRTHSEIISCPRLGEYTNRKVTVRVSDTISSPLLIGVAKPTLLLPNSEITPDQLHNILAHEMTHLKRRDILYKWFVNIVKCVHWFNPAIYFIGNQISIDCEISCDLAVVDNMDQTEEQRYVSTILALISSRSRNIPLTTAMAGNKQSLKRRFTMIKNRKKFSKKAMIISLVIAAALLIGAVFASGLLNGTIFQKAQDQEGIKITNNGELLVLDNKPFVEDGMVYLPLEELVEKLNPQNEIQTEGEEIAIHIENSLDEYLVQTGRKEIQYTQPDPVALAARNTNYAPIEKNGLVYIPYEYAQYLLVDANGYDLNGSVLYQNQAMNIQFEIPILWCGKYFVDESRENYISFRQTATAEKYEGAGVLFGIRKVMANDLEQEMNVGGNKTIVWQNDQYAYVLNTPTDVQYPIWSDRDKEDIGIAEEYEQMFDGIEHIEKTFALIDDKNS